MRQHRDLLIDLNLLLLAIISGAVVLFLSWRVLTTAFPVLVLLLAAMLLAFLLEPLVARLESAGVARSLAVLSVYALLLALVFGLGGLFLVPLANQIRGLALNLPADVSQLRHFLLRWDVFLARHHIPLQLESLQHEGLSYAQRTGRQLLGSTLDIVLIVSHIVIDFVAVIVISLYLLIDGPRLRHNILRLIPEGPRHQVLFFEAAVHTVVGGYVRGQLLLSLTIGLMAAGGTWLIGVPYPLVLGLAAGFFELVPMLGPILGALPAIILAALHSWQLAGVTVCLYIVIQQLEAHVIAPRIIGHAVGIHPIVAILAVLLGAELDGAFGALVAVPIAGFLYVVAQAEYAQITGRQQVVTTVVRRRPIYVRLFRRIQGHFRRREVKQDEGIVMVTVEAPSDQLASIVHEQQVLAEEFEIAERAAQEAEEDGSTASTPIRRKPDDRP